MTTLRNIGFWLGAASGLALAAYMYADMFGLVPQ